MTTKTQKTRTSISFKSILAVVLPVLAITSVGLITEADAYLIHWATDADTTQIAGAKGTLTVDDPNISTNGISSDFRDYMVHVNLPTSSTIGSGWYAYKSSGDIKTWDQTYYYDDDQGWQVRNQFTEITSVPKVITVYIKQQTNADSDCWRADTWSGATTRCFSDGSDEGTWAGIAAYAKKAYSSNSNGMKGLFDNLQKGRWSESSVIFDKDFSEDSSFTHCDTVDSYVIDLLNGVDKMGTGPEGYTTDDCGESALSGSPYGY